MAGNAAAAEWVSAGRRTSMNSVTSMVAPWSTHAPWNWTMLLLRQDRRMATSRQNLTCADHSLGAQRVSACWLDTSWRPRGC